MVQPVRLADPTLSSTRDSAIFFVYAAAALALLLSSFAVGRRGDVAAFGVVPALALALLYENVAIAVTALCGDTYITVGMQRIRAAEQSFVIPLFLVGLFELTYAVHKRRSANLFCGCIRFDEGHRTSTGFFGNLVRRSLWLAAIIALFVQILVNAPEMADPLSTMGATTRFTSKSLGIGRTDGDIDWSDAVDFAPYVLLVTFALYVGIALWRFGTTISTDVRATAINPWMSTACATVGLVLAWGLTPPAWPLPYAVNALELCLVGALVITLALVELNFATLDNWAAVLATANDAVIAVTAARAKEAELLQLKGNAAATPWWRPGRRERIQHRRAVRGASVAGSSSGVPANRAQGSAMVPAAVGGDAPETAPQVEQNHRPGVAVAVADEGPLRGVGANDKGVIHIEMAVNDAA